MAHSINYITRTVSVLDRYEVEDLIELLYRWGDSKFNIIFEQKDKKSGVRGRAVWHSFENIHEVTLFVDTITKHFHEGKRLGGNQPAKTLKAAFAMVLAHELQHCNQKILHKNVDSAFYTGHRYINLACEREARGFVDERLNEIHAYFGIENQSRSVNISQNDDEELSRVIDLLGECEFITTTDINDELRASKIMNPNNFMTIKNALVERGIEIRKN